MSQVEHFRGQAATRPPQRKVVKQTATAMAKLEAETIVRLAGVQAEGMVSKAKMVELDHLAREAMTGQAMLVGWAGTLAKDNAMLYDELQFFVGIARLGKGQVIADIVDDYCDERRRR